MEIHLPPKLTGLCIVLMILLHYGFPIAIIIPYPYNLFGLLLVASGLGLGIVTKRKMQRSKTTLHPDKTASTLITTGPFNFSRNPYYVSYVGLCAGFAIVLGSLSVFIGPMLLFWVLHYKVIPAEERSLEREFGKKFLDYSQRVRRWL